MHQTSLHVISLAELLLSIYVLTAINLAIAAAKGEDLLAGLVQSMTIILLFLALCFLLGYRFNFNI